MPWTTVQIHNSPLLGPILAHPIQLQNFTSFFQSSHSNIILALTLLSRRQFCSHVWLPSHVLHAQPLASNNSVKPPYNTSVLLFFIVVQLYLCICRFECVLHALASMSVCLSRQSTKQLEQATVETPCCDRPLGSRYCNTTFNTIVSSVIPFELEWYKFTVRFRYAYTGNKCADLTRRQEEVWNFTVIETMAENWRSAVRQCYSLEAHSGPVFNRQKKRTKKNLH